MFNHVFQDPFTSLLEISEQGVLGIYIGIISEHNSSQNMSFGVGIKLIFVLLLQIPFIISLSTSIQRVQKVNKILTWLH